MRIHQFLLSTLLLMSTPLLGLLIWLSMLSWHDHVEDRRSSITASATAAWIDGQVALSLERSLTQVAFALEPESRNELLGNLSSQRRIVDEHFNITFEQIKIDMFAAENGLQLFQNDALDLRDQLQQTRTRIDGALQQTSGCADDCTHLIEELIDIIDQTAALRAALNTPSGLINIKSLDFLLVQSLAWEAREFAGRVRTPYVVATINDRTFSDYQVALIEEHLRLGMQAWHTLQKVALRIDRTNPIVEAISIAQSSYYDEHITLLRQIDPSMDVDDAASRLDFETLFELSTVALETISDVASVSGEQIENYWTDRQAASLKSFWFTSLSSAAAIVALAAVVIALRSHLVRPIVNATSMLSRVADGDLKATNTSMELRLSEIQALHDVVESFRVSLRKSQVAEIEARTDHLTRLPNRRDIEERFAKTAESLAEGDAFLYVDLDEFKPINDSFGHQAGDKVLQVTAERLRRFATENTKVWRLGGDEFGLLVENVPSTDVAVFIADQLHDILTSPIDYNDDELFVGASIGIAMYDTSVRHFQDLFSRADLAMFMAKQSPTKNTEVHGDSIQTRRFGHESRRSIRAALGNREIFPLFQPQVDLATGAIIGFEALARWRREDGTQMGPGEFMDMVEYFGALGELDLLIAEQTMDTMRGIHAKGLNKPRFSINVSEDSLASREIRNAFLNLFNRHAALTKFVTVEVTENALIDRSAQAIRSSLQSFAKAGIALSMDDFGTGYGSFRHLQEYQFSEVKIDRSFVNKICTDRASEVIISGFLDVASGLNATVVAEGIENEQQRVKLVELGCRFGQGFHFAEPLEASELMDAIKENDRMAS